MQSMSDEEDQMFRRQPMSTVYENEQELRLSGGKEDRDIRKVCIFLIRNLTISADQK